jgi:Flp pilus assembly pilin Flp
MRRLRLIASWSRRAARDEGGASAVELALTVTVFMLLLMGGINYGLYLWTANALQQTAIQTARCMGVLQTGCQVGRAYSSSSTTTFAEQVAAGYGLKLTGANLALSAGAPCGGQGMGNSSIKITYAFVGIAPGLTPGLSNTMRAQACFPNQS